MGRTWLQIRVDLLGGPGIELRPAPGRIFIVGPAHTFEQFAEAINQAFGGYDQFKQQLTQAATTRFGSGWAWLVAEPGGGLRIMSTPNQDTPLMPEYGGAYPILGVDVWEHAYYLDYENRRPEYVAAFLNHLVNWDEVAAELHKAL